MSIYNNGKIYKLVNSFGTTYVGSTTQTLAQRKTKHVCCYKADLRGEQKSKIRSLMVFIEDPENVDIVLLEIVNCNSKMELHQRERYYIENLECVNKYIPCRTEKEYRNANSIKIKEYKKMYNIKNSEELKKVFSQYRKDNIEHKKMRDSNIDICECGCEVSHGAISKHKKSAKHNKLMAKKEII